MIVKKVQHVKIKSFIKLNNYIIPEIINIDIDKNAVKEQISPCREERGNIINLLPKKTDFKKDAINPNLPDMSEFSEPTGYTYKVYWKRRGLESNETRFNNFLRTSSQEKAKSHLIFLKFKYPEYVFMLTE